MNRPKDLDPRTVTIQRTFKAPVALVWEAWTQPDHIANWWGPKGMNTQILKHEFRVGGAWAYSMTMPDGNEFLSEGVYSEIIEQEKIFSSANFKPMTEGVEIQALFAGNEEETHFTFNVIHPTEEYRIQQENMGIYNGWGSVFDRLTTHLQSLVG